MRGMWKKATLDIFFALAISAWSCFAFAQNAGQGNVETCLPLEGLNLGCVASVDHSCKKNKALYNPAKECYYVGEPSTSIRVEGPIAFHCAATESTETCTETIGENGSIHRECRTTSRCVRYQAPFCEETCVPCYNKVVSANIGMAAGCIICTRRPCDDEKDFLVKGTCPNWYNGMPKGPPQRCSGAQRCPTTAIDPNGVTHQVTIQSSPCPPPSLPNPPLEDPERPPRCPWKRDERTGGSPPGPNGEGGSAGNCEPISEDNRQSPYGQD